MGSFFVVQVRTGTEIETKEMLKLVLDRANNCDVKAIYAMETYTEVLNSDAVFSLSESLEHEDISEFLHVKRMQSLISNLRVSYNSLKESNMGLNEDSLELLETYRMQIRSLTQSLKALRTQAKKMRSLLSGYILVEMMDDSTCIPNQLWHLIKSVPKVVSIPSKYNIPKAEVDMFFENLDMTPQIEIQFEDMISTLIELEQLQDENLSDPTVDQPIIPGELDEFNAVHNVDAPAQFHPYGADQSQNTLSSLRASLQHFFLHRSRKERKVVISLSRFKQLTGSFSNIQTLFHSKKDFLNVLIALLRDNFAARDVVLYDG